MTTKVKRSAGAPLELPLAQARRLWIAAQGLDTAAPFGSGPEAVRRAVAHLGYVQIDTINVIERSHHHILFSRIPTYRRADLATAQSVDKSVFEYWTHALAYVPTKDFPFFAADMLRHRRTPDHWYADVPRRDVLRILRRVREEGALSISDITDDVPVDRDHPWASRKPSKRMLEAAFYCGELVIARRTGMLKSYELTLRHFGWERFPKPASPAARLRYRVDRALRTQGIVSVDSVCYLDAKSKSEVRAYLEKEARAKRLVKVRIEGDDKTPCFVSPDRLDTPAPEPRLTHILSPFDPLVIQRKRTAHIFGYEHLFEAYLPKEKRKLGYFTLPVLSGDEIVAALDLKAARESKTLMIQTWHWIGAGNARDHKPAIDAALEKFTAFQFGDPV